MTKYIKQLLTLVSIAVILLLTSCDPNGTILPQIRGGVVPGTISFETTQLTLGVNQPGDVVLTLSGSSEVNGVVVKVSSQDKDIAVVNTRQCVLSSAVNSCEISLTGGNESGATQITATASGYNIAPVEVTTSSNIVPGTLQLIHLHSVNPESSINVTNGSTASFRVRLAGSSGESDVAVTLSSSNHGVATIQSPSGYQCLLSSGSSTNKCTVVISGNSNGQATITASSPGYQSESLAADVSSTSNPGTISFSVTSESLSNGSTESVALNLSDASGISPVTVTLNSSNTALVTESPTSCTLSLSSPSCVVTLTAASGIQGGNTTITAVATGYTITPLSVNVSSLGTLGFYNMAGESIDSKSVYTNESKVVQLRLINSIDISPFTVNLNLGNSIASIESPTSQACSLSSAESVCSIVLLGGAESGSDILTAAPVGSGYQSVPLNVNVKDSTSPGRIFFSPSTASVAMHGESIVTLSWLDSRGIQTPVTVTLGSANANIATINPESCTLQPESSCSLALSGESVGSTIINATASGYDIESLNVAVTIPVPYQPTTRFGVTNNCTESVWVQMESPAGEVGTSTLLAPGASYSYQVESTTFMTGVQVWPKLGCNASGESCAIGQEDSDGGYCTGPNGDVCQPPIDSKLNINFESAVVTYGIDLINGYSLPFSVTIYPGTGETTSSCHSENATANLSMAGCPTSAALTTAGMASVFGIGYTFGPYYSYTNTVAPFTSAPNLGEVNEMYTVSAENSLDGESHEVCYSPYMVLAGPNAQFFGGYNLSANESNYADYLNDPVLMYACPFQQGGVGDLSAYESTNTSVWPIESGGDGLQKMSNYCKTLSGGCTENNEASNAHAICENGPVNSSAYVNYIHSVAPGIPAYQFDSQSVPAPGTAEYTCVSSGTQITLTFCPNGTQ